PDEFVMNYFNTQSGSSTVATASVSISRKNEEITEAATGNGPVDAVYQAISRATGYPLKLVTYQLTAKGEGRDALGQVD
ncbi:2-isopropylmalate synthase, partial [Klebsiella oxytoca]